MREAAANNPEKFYAASKSGTLGTEEVLVKVTDHIGTFVLGYSVKSCKAYPVTRAASATRRASRTYSPFTPGLTGQKAILTTIPTPQYKTAPDLEKARTDLTLAMAVDLPGPHR